jgi:hypothetical protein
MEEMGHTDPALALKVYAQAMRRGGRKLSSHRGGSYTTSSDSTATVADSQLPARPGDPDT